MAATVSGSIREDRMFAPRWNSPAVHPCSASRLPKMPPSGSPQEIVQSKSVVMSNARFFVGCKASLWMHRSFLSAKERRYGHSGVFHPSESVVLPVREFFIGCKASVRPIRSFLLAGKRPFARWKIFYWPDSAVLPGKKPGVTRKASFCQIQNPFAPGKCPIAGQKIQDCAKSVILAAFALFFTS